MTERELRALAAYFDFPAERDLAPAVRARLAPRPRRRRALIVVLAALALAAAIAFAVPPARSAILRFLHLRGVRIELVDKLPEVKTSGQLDLGRPIALADAERTAGFRPLESKLLGDPDGVSWDGEQLWFTYGHLRLLLSEFRAGGIDRFIKKGVEPGTRIDAVVVNGGQGFFISGARHFLYLAPTGAVHDERVRLARNVLLWEQGPLTLRLEGELTLGQALRIARSLR
jgi:hypothetical protein